MSKDADTITPETRIPLKVAWSLVAFSAIGTGMLYGIYSRLGTIEAAVNQSWTLDNQRVYAAQMKGSNPQLTIPDVDAIKGRK